MRRIIVLKILAWIPDAIGMGKNSIRISFARIRIFHRDSTFFFFSNERIYIAHSLPNKILFYRRESITDTIFIQIAHVSRIIE